jgi:hypothetical protein
MEQRHRFIFSGNAAAFGGRIIRPKDVSLEAPAGSSLPVTGGRSVAQIPATAFEDFFAIESASTLAEGLFDDADRLRELTYHKVQEDTLTTSTHVSADVTGLVVGSKPRLTVKHLRAELNAKSPRASGQAAIRVGDGTTLDGITIDAYRLVVELNLAPFQRFDTYAKLLTAVDDPAFVKESADALFLRTRVDGQLPPPRTGRLIDSSSTIYATIVKSIAWDGEPFPDSRIDHNMVIVPGLGRLYFGELLISATWRRLTMLRMSLGSPMGGFAAAADVESNGSWGY